MTLLYRLSTWWHRRQLDRQIKEAHGKVEMCLCTWGLFGQSHPEHYASITDEALNELDRLVSIRDSEENGNVSLSSDGGELSTK